MKSIKRKVEKKLRRKTNQGLVETILAGKKEEKWQELSHLISRPRRKQMKFNLGEIEKMSKEGEVVIVAGKVLGEGELTKKVKLAAFQFSESAIVKLKKHKIEFHELKEEIEKNPDAKNVHILKSMDE